MKTENEILETLNPEQREVVLHDKGPLLAVAVAGAGKTKTVVHRIAYLVAVRGVDPKKILAVTFSKKGADEMNERLVKLIGETEARVGTFHSLGLEILREEMTTTWTVDDRNRFAICLKDAVGYKELNIAKEVDITELQSFIGRCKASIARPGSDDAHAIAKHFFDGRGERLAMEAYQRAEELRRDRKLLTFDDMILDAAEMLKQDEVNGDDEVRARWSNRWDYVIQDEAQDQNLCQLVIGEKLAQDHRNYMLVGDPAQTIFSFRGARPDKLLGFEKTWGARVITMGKNYRCGDCIISTANQALDMMNAAERLPTAMEACRGVPGLITSVCHPNTELEASWIADRARTLHEDGKLAWADMVVLYRTHACSRAIEEAMLTARIPYVVLGGANFYERREVRALLAYLRLASGRGDGDDVERCINSPFRFLGRAFVERVVGAAQDAHRSGEELDWVAIVRKVAAQANIQARQKRSAEEWASMIHDAADAIAGTVCIACKGSGDEGPGSEDTSRCVSCGGTGNIGEKSPADILRSIVRRTGYIQWLKDDEGDESVENDRASNVAALTETVAPRFQTTAELLNYIEETQRKVATERKNAGKDDKVILTSCHRAKGLEWPVVFLAGVSQGQFPHAFAENIEEEKRLFYVGITRARDELHVSSTKIGVNGKAAGESSFLGAVGLAAG